VLVDRPLVLVDGADAVWLAPIVSGALLEARRAGMTIGDRPLKLLADLEELAGRHREAAAVVLAEATEMAERTSAAHFSSDVLWSVAMVAKVANLKPRRVQALAAAGVLRSVSRRPYQFEQTTIAEWIEARRQTA